MRWKGVLHTSVVYVTGDRAFPDVIAYKTCILYKKYSNVHHLPYMCRWMARVPSVTPMKCT